LVVGASSRFSVELDWFLVEFFQAVDGNGNFLRFCVGFRKRTEATTLLARQCSGWFILFQSILGLAV
jgi:hypothetical protein